MGTLRKLFTKPAKQHDGGECTPFVFFSHVCVSSQCYNIYSTPCHVAPRSACIPHTNHTRSVQLSPVLRALPLCFTHNMFYKGHSEMLHLKLFFFALLWTWSAKTHLPLHTFPLSKCPFLNILCVLRRRWRSSFGSNTEFVQPPLLLWALELWIRADAAVKLPQSGFARPSARRRGAAVTESMRASGWIKFEIFLIFV